MNLIQNSKNSQLLYLPILILLRFQFSSCSEPNLTICPPVSCNPNGLDTIQFPFHVPRNQTRRCGYPGFDLTCGQDGRTLLTLGPKPLTVQAIYYTYQISLLSDPNSCIPSRVLTLNLTSTPYTYGQNTPLYTFLNCSNTNITNVDPDKLPIGTSVVSCLSRGDYTVMMTFERPSEKKLVSEMKCRVIKRENVAFWWPEMDEGLYPHDMSDVIMQLNWDKPSCGDCYVNGGSCGFANDFGLDVGCLLPTKSAGLPRSAKYGLILGAGIPSVLCMIGLTYYISSRARARNRNLRHTTDTELSPTIYPQPMILTVGLDRSAIESYPKTILGESKRLPKTSDGTCPICLSDYQPKETLRSIPDCNHFFHADCIDEWLQMKATCPLCRKLPHQQV